MSKKKMDAEGIQYEDVDMSQNAEAADLARSLGYRSAPVIIAADGEHWSGFRPDKIKSLASLAAV